MCESFPLFSKFILSLLYNVYLLSTSHIPTNNTLLGIQELIAIKDILKTLNELVIVSYAITMTAAILGVAILVIVATSQVNQARAVYGCINLPGTRSIPSTYTCLDKPTESNIWKSESQLNATLNATGSYHANGILWVFMNETVTANPTPECKAQNDYLSRNASLSNDTTTTLTLSNKCEDSIYNWNQIHPNNAIINPNEQIGQGLNG